MEWAKYDVIYRQKRAKQIVRRPKKFKSWSVTDIELYLSCNSLHEVCPKLQAYKQAHAPPSSTNSGEGPQFKSGTCLKFQSAKGCDGSCMWPNTHSCYSCGGPRSTKTCPTVTASYPPTHHGADTKSPFRQLETKADKSGPREDRDRYDYKDKDDLVSEEWHRGSSR